MSVHVIVLPGGGYEVHAVHEAEPIVDWLSGLGLDASVFRYPLNSRHFRPRSGACGTKGPTRSGSWTSRPVGTSRAWRPSLRTAMSGHRFSAFQPRAFTPGGIASPWLRRGAPHYH